MDLTPRQRQAARRQGQDVCLVAGPGSGKTRVLIERFRWLVDECGASPLDILAITFTEKAATEIKQRLVRSFDHRSEIRAQIERAYVSTVHGFCARLLREHAIAAGLDPQFTVLEATESQAELEQAAHAALDRLFDARPAEFGRLVDAIDAPGRLAAALMESYWAMRTAGRTVAELRGCSEGPPPVTLASLAAAVRRAVSDSGTGVTPARRKRNAGLLVWARHAELLAVCPLSQEHFRLVSDFQQFDRRGLEEGDPVRACIERMRNGDLDLLRASFVTEQHTELRSLLLDALDEMDLSYRCRKSELSAMDFSDLEERAIDLLRRDSRLCECVRRRFRQILMDELQDTNPLQWKLLDLIRSPNQFFGVGDLNQSIFGFRHAEPDLFRRYREQVEASDKHVDRLFENHRSRAEILAAVQVVADQAPGIEEHVLEPKRLFPVKNIPSVEVLVAQGKTAEEAQRREARWVARRIRELVDTLEIEERKEDRKTVRRARFRDVGVLVRTYNAMPLLQEAFLEFGVPHLTAGGKYFYESREARDLLHLLRVIANARDEVAMAAVLRSPIVGVSDETLFRLRMLGGNLRSAVLGLPKRDTSAFDVGDLEKLSLFRAQLAQARRQRADVPPDRLLARFLDESAYEEGLDSRARANIDKLLAHARAWYRRRPGSLAGLVADLERRRAHESEPDAPPDDSSDVVRLITVHKAKGLEFPIVFLPALQRGLAGDSPSICVSPEGEFGVRWLDPATSKVTPELAYLRRQAQLKRQEDAEEDRLLYVAMTRAEEHLVLSFAATSRWKQHWAARVAGQLGFNPEDADERPLVRRFGDGFEARLFRTAADPEVPKPLAGEEAHGLEVQILDPPGVAGLHDSTVTVTELATFARCPRRYFLGDFLGRATTVRRPLWEEETGERDGDEPGAAEFGLDVHALLAGRVGEGPSAEARELAARFQASELGRRAARASRVEREFDFLLAVEDTVLRGQIDLWFEEAGEIVLVDYKTDDVKPEQAEARAEEYAVQLRLYGLAIERLAGRPPTAAFAYFLRPNRAVPVSLGDGQLAETRRFLNQLREAQETLRFDLREGEHCARCPFFRGPCPATSLNTAGQADGISGRFTG